MIMKSLRTLKRLNAMKGLTRTLGKKAGIQRSSECREKTSFSDHPLESKSKSIRTISFCNSSDKLKTQVLL